MRDRRRADHRPGACRAGPARWPPGHDRCRGAPRARHRGRDRRAGPGGPRPRPRSAGCRAARRCRVLQRGDLDTRWCRRPTTRARARARRAGPAHAAGSAFSRSILFSATTIGTSAALACWMASIVWGMTPSSAATTRTTMSVASAPRARMAVNASWPGVSMKVSGLPSFDLVGADVLGDATGLAGDDVGVADLVEELRLAVVDVAHDGDDGRAVRPATRTRRLRRPRGPRAPSGARPPAPGPD